MFLFCFILGLILGLVVIFSSDNYLKLLTSENKIMYPLINGTAEKSVLFWKKLLGFSIPLVLLFGLGLNYYTSLLSYIFITYQSSLLILSCGAVVKTYGFSGFFNILFVTLPLNIFYFALLIFFGVTCFVRSKSAHRAKQFMFGFDEEFFLKIIISFVFVIILCVGVCVVYPMFLKNSIFIIF